MTGIFLHTFFVLLSFILMTSCSKSSEKMSAMRYPETLKVDTVDVYFGEEVKDPYRWLEDDRSPETAEWVERQNDVTFGYLDKIPYRDKIKQRLEKLYNYERLSAPTKEGDYYYYFKNDGLQNHSVLYRKKELDGTPEVFWIQTLFLKMVRPACLLSLSRRMVRSRHI